MKQNVFSPTLLTTAGTAPRAFLFDFDLTLADGSAWIVACYHEVLARHGFAAVDDETIRGTIGLTVEDSFALMTGIDDAARLHDLRVEYKALCRPGMAAHTRLFPDAGRFLQFRVSGIEPSCCQQRRAANDGHLFKKHHILAGTGKLNGGNHACPAASYDDGISFFDAIGFGVFVDGKIFGNVSRFISAELHRHVEDVAVVAVRKGADVPVVACGAAVNR